MLHWMTFLPVMPASMLVIQELVWTMILAHLNMGNRLGTAILVEMQTHMAMLLYFREEVARILQYTQVVDWVVLVTQVVVVVQDHTTESELVVSPGRRFDLCKVMQEISNLVAGL
ncbi:hypothetical protein Bca52824_049751 [Brassica carinata]|uniref:Uncharacterized protein n=1 Tax=Brassica carinata TaxID=52824 RepID=A0A8X7UTC2_BRACI|nr:hypothetical protein Bca52824_049751 [Brassica carinata]